MPIYEYQCKKCGQFEIMQRITEAPLKRCPTCQSKVTKLISNTSFQLKGSGWYITDYGRKGSAAAGNNKETASTDSKSSDSTSDAKPSDTASKADAKSSKSDTKSSAKSSEPAAA